MVLSSIGLFSCFEFNFWSIQELDKCSFFGEGEKLGSFLFKEELSLRDVVELIDFKSKKELFLQISGQVMVLQVLFKLYQVLVICFMKVVDYYLSLDNFDYMFFFLELEDEDEVLYFIQLYRFMIVKCVDCVLLFFQFRDIIDS